MEIPILNISDKSVSSAITVDDRVFKVDFNEGLVHRVLTAYQSNARLGLKGWKGRGDVRGSTKKPWAQKGTGRARAGTKKSPIWRSGGVTFAYTDRNYLKKVNKKEYRKAMACILSKLIEEQRISIVDDFQLESYKTKSFLNLLSHFEIKDLLIIKEKIDPNLILASRNLYAVNIVSSFDPLSLIGSKCVICEKSALENIQSQLSKR